MAAPIDVQRRPLALLAMLAVAGQRGIARDTVVARLWPDAKPEAGRNALRQTLFALRRALESADTVTGTSLLRLDERIVESDVQTFVATVRARDRAAAVHLYTGPLLDGFTVGRCPEFEQWLEGERAAFARQYARLLDDLAQAATEAGDHTGAAHWWARAADHDPLGGRVATGYVRALGAAGDYPAALQYARRYAIRLRQELEVMPDAEFTRLVASFRARVAETPSAGASRPQINPAGEERGTPAVDPASAARYPVSPPTGLPTAGWPKVLAGAAAALASIALLASAKWVLPVLHPARIAQRDSQPSVATAHRSTAIRLAVLPVEVSGEAIHSYMARGIGDVVRDRLTSYPELEVIASASSASYGPSRTVPPRLGSDLGVRYVLLGRVDRAQLARSDDQVDVHMELVDLTTNTDRWGRRYTVSRRDLRWLPDSVVASVTNALGVRSLALQDTTARANRTTDVVGYDAFLRGEEAFGSNASGDNSRLSSAVRYYREALSHDSLFAPAWVQLARSEAHMYATVFRRTAADSAHAAAAMARALAPDWAPTFLAAGVVANDVDQDYERARHEFNEALRRAPTNVAVLNATADAERSTGLWDAAVAHYQEIQRLDPRDIRAPKSLSWTLLLLRRYREAQQTAERGLELAPANLPLRHTLAAIALAQGDLAGAHRVMQAAPAEVDRTVLAAFFSKYSDLAWALDDSLRSLVSKPSDNGFGDDSASLWVTMAEIATWAARPTFAHQYALEALTLSSRETASSPRNPFTHLNCAFELGYLGRSDASMREAELALALTRAQHDELDVGDMLVWNARMAVLAGKYDRAIDFLDEALRRPSIVSVAWLRIDTNFAPLRADKRFQRLTAPRADGA